MWAKGLDYESVPFFKPEKKKIIIPIEVEEIFEFTSEGEDDDYEPSVEKVVEQPHEVITFKSLKEKQKKQPFGNALARGFSQIVKHKKVTHNEEDFKILQIGRNMGNSSLSINTMVNSTVDKGKAKSMFNRGSDKNLVGPSFNPNFGRSMAPSRVAPMPTL